MIALMVRIRPVVIALLLLCPLMAARADSEYSVRATRTEDKISIDGRMDEAAWATAPLLTNFHQTRVELGKPAREQTEVRILYDRENLYFGFHCLDSHPDEVTAYSVQNESFLHQEDNVTVMIDSYLDHRNSYYFWTNMLGVRTDGRIVNDGESFGTDWQGEWEAKGSRVADGWIVEIRIPFRNFQYDNADEHTFGVMLDREEARLQEWSNWTHDGVTSAKVSQYPHLTGLKDIAPRSIATVTPYISTQLVLPPTSLSPGVPLDSSISSQGLSLPIANSGMIFAPNAGVDATIDPTSWASLKLTLNPDFAQFDVDQDVLYLNTEERYIPERRQFFREGQELFITPITLFFSRRIAPHAYQGDHVWGGAQLVGKKGGTSFSLLDVQYTENPENGSATENVNAGVVRLQQDLGNRSSVSVIGLNRLGDIANLKNTLLGADANLHLFEEFFMQLQAAKSWSAVGPSASEAYHVGIHRYTTLSEVWLEVEDIGKNFRDFLGYVPVIDKQVIDWHGYYTWFTKVPVIERVDVTYDALWRRNHDGVPTRHREQLTVQPYIGNHLALYLDALYDYNANFENKIGTFGFIINPNDWQGLSVFGLMGNFLGGGIAGGNMALNWKFGPHVSLKLSAFYTYSSNVPENSPLFGVSGNGHQWSGYAQLRYQFTPDFYARITFQRGETLGLADINSYNGQVIDAVLGWHYRLGSDFFLVYTDQPVNNQQEHRILSKISLMLF